jgi:hypothetical protein
MSFREFTELEDEIGRITLAAEGAGIPLRVFGGAAMRLHCPMHQELYASLGRSSNHDMDFVTYDGLGEQTRRFFVSLGYDPHVSMALSVATGTGRHRQMFYDKLGNKAVDVCLGVLKMSHVIDFSSRLEVDSPTVPLAELALQKLQIVEMREKDLQDMVILLCAHDVGRGDEETINSDHVAKTLSKDWGFHYTATRNLRRIAQYAANHPNISKADKDVVAARVQKLMDAIDAEPKSAMWKLRAKIGTTVKWYNVVEEVEP